MKYEYKDFNSVKYLIRYPESFEEGKKYPVLFFFHGAGTRGCDLDLLKNNAFFTATDKYGDFPFVTVAPQCHEDTWFDMFTDLKRFVLKALDFGFVDLSRVYGMGASMGGYALWQLGMSLPDVFAAIIPICGGGMYWNARRLSKTKIWAFHGADDTTVLPGESEEMVARVNGTGGDAKLTLYKNVGHDSWAVVYSDYSVFKWLLRQRKGEASSAFGDGGFNDQSLFG